MILSKLITHEDKFHIHKTMGLLTLTNFIFQTIHYFAYQKLYYINQYIFIHIFLHMTSFIFQVLSKRPKAGDKMKMFIWEELRLHSMIFAYRACFSILFPEYARVIIFLTMIAADLTTKYVGDDTFTTVRGQHDKEKSWKKQIYSVFFSMSQMGATAICSGCFQPNYNKFLTFQTLIPIQTSAFGLTLLRKNIIDKTTWQVVYSIELSLVYIYWYYEYGNLYIIPMSGIPYFFRKIGFSKYIIWLLFVLIDYLQRENIDIFNYVKIKH